MPQTLKKLSQLLCRENKSVDLNEAIIFPFPLMEYLLYHIIYV